jgi:hypothetical protein
MALIKFKKGLKTNLPPTRDDNTIYVTADEGGGYLGNTDLWLPKSGGTLTGSLNLYKNPTSSLEAATKSYVDSGSPAVLQAYYAASAVNWITDSGATIIIKKISNSTCKFRVTGGVVCIVPPFITNSYYLMIKQADFANGATIAPFPTSSGGIKTCDNDGLLFNDNMILFQRILPGAPNNQYTLYWTLYHTYTEREAYDYQIMCNDGGCLMLGTKVICNYKLMNIGDTFTWTGTSN